jgi:hypothetical protein
VRCYQRGYYPQELYQGYLKIAGVCFESSETDEASALSKTAFDFFLVIAAHDNQVAAACVVEFRPAVDRAKTPYLYISTLCTNPAFGHNGLAHQLVHAVYTLGTLMVEQNNLCAGAWRGAIPNKHLYIGLTVRIKRGHEKLLHLYSHCGFDTACRWADVKYESFTPYSVYSWQMNRSGMVPMYKEITSDLVYEDPQISIYSPGFKGQATPMYHAFPGTQLQAVKENGIIYSKHACLYADQRIFYTTDRIQFSKGASPLTAFRIHVARAECDTVCMRISVPAWFASGIYSDLTVS